MPKQDRLAAIRSLTRLAAVFTLMCTAGARLHASGFEIMERSTEGIGKSFAGATAGFSDGSSTYFNPATMMIFDQQVLNAGAHLILPRTEFEDKGSRYVDGSPIPDTDGGDGGVVPVVPSIYYVFP